MRVQSSNGPWPIAASSPTPCSARNHGEEGPRRVGAERMTALADRGYFNAPEILACEQAGHHPTGSEAPHIEQQGRRQVRQAGLHLRPEGGRVRVPGGRTGDPSLCERRERADVAQVLVVRLSPSPMKQNAQPPATDESRGGSMSTCSRSGARKAWCGPLRPEGSPSMLSSSQS